MLEEKVADYKATLTFFSPSINISKIVYTLTYSIFFNCLKPDIEYFTFSLYPLH